MTRLVLVRHGEPEDWVRGRCYGQLDPGLSARGREQIEWTKHWLAGLSSAAIYASPQRRALDTVALVARRGDRVIVDARLREMNFGKFEGMTYDDIAEQFAETYQEWMLRPTEVCFPHGETFSEMTDRVRAALEDVRRMHAGQVVTIVSHGGVNRIALADALGLPLEHMFRLQQDYGCINIIDYAGDTPLVRLANGTCEPTC
jgi:alpha-ribazole phosphatase